MTDDELDTIEARWGASIDTDMAALVAEVRRLRALPVIVTCRGCAHRDMDECCHGAAPKSGARPATRYLPAMAGDYPHILPDSAPPEWCPLRSKP